MTSQITFSNISPISINSSNTSFIDFNSVSCDMTPDLNYTNSICSSDKTNYHTNLKEESDSFFIKGNSNSFNNSSFLINQPIKKIHSGLKMKDINNEVAKSIFINKYIKPVYQNKYITDTQKFLLNEKKAQKINERYDLLKKRYPHSNKKVYQSKIGLQNIKGKIEFFSLYNDSDIGIKPEWDDNLKYQKCDNLITTPNWSISQAIEDNINSIADAIINN